MTDDGRQDGKSRPKHQPLELEDDGLFAEVPAETAKPEARQPKPPAEQAASPDAKPGDKVDEAGEVFDDELDFEELEDDVIEELLRVESEPPQGPAESQETSADATSEPSSHETAPELFASEQDPLLVEELDEEVDAVLDQLVASLAPKGTEQPPAEAATDAELVPAPDADAELVPGPDADAELVPGPDADAELVPGPDADAELVPGPDAGERREGDGAAAQRRSDVGEGEEDFEEAFYAMFEGEGEPDKGEPSGFEELEEGDAKLVSEPQQDEAVAAEQEVLPAAQGYAEQDVEQPVPSAAQAQEQPATDSIMPDGGLVSAALVRSSVPVDRGALAAQRTLLRRSGSHEGYPLVGQGDEVDRTRSLFLEHLAERSSGGHRARLLMAAGELRERIGDSNHAAGLRAAALEADPKDLLVIREGRRDAFRAAQWNRAAELLRAEAELPLSQADKALALTALAEVIWTRLEEPDSALEAAMAASQANPSSVAANLLLSEILIAAGRSEQAVEALCRIAEVWQEPEARCALLTEAARRSERSGDVQRARELFERASESNPNALEALLGKVRTARTNGDIDAAIDTLLRIAELVGEGGLREELMRTAARLAHAVADRPQQALELLQEPETVLGLRARARAAEAVDDRDALRAALEAWAQVSRGSERAIALLELAQLHDKNGDADRAEEALQHAHQADEALDSIRVVREMMARRSGDAARVADVLASDADANPLAVAAKLAMRAEHAERECELLERASHQSDGASIAEVIWLDAAGELGNTGAVSSALERLAEGAASEQRLGPLLAWAEVLAEQQLADESAKALQRAAAESPGSPLVLRHLARVADDHAEAAEYWLQEAAAAQGERAAFAAATAGRHLHAAERDPLAAYAKALEAVPGYLPAWWALEPMARGAHDIESSLRLQEQVAELSADPVERCSRLTRAALLAGDLDDLKAAALLRQALEMRPEDPVLGQLLLRVSDSLAPGYLAERLEGLADGGPETLGRVAMFRAAAAREDAGDLERAAELYQQLLDKTVPPDPFAAHCLNRVQLAAGQSELVAGRLAAKAAAAAGERAPLDALRELADFQAVHGTEEDAAEAAKSLVEVMPNSIAALRVLERQFMRAGTNDELLRVAEAFVQHLVDPADVAAHLRFAVRLRELADEEQLDAADGLVLETTPRAAPDLWLARRFEAAARRAQDGRRVAEALNHSMEYLTDPMERVCLALRLSEVLERLSPQLATEKLSAALEADPDYPGAAEELGRLHEIAGDNAAAAEAYERAARSARSDEREPRLWHRAGVLWQDAVKDSQRALQALRNIEPNFVAYDDVFTRLKQLLQDGDDLAGLAELLEARLQIGGEPAQLTELTAELAAVRSKTGDRQGAKKAVRQALELDPDNTEGLRALADLHLEDEEWQDAADLLIRLARLIRDAEELRKVFMTLGDIYSTHIPDLHRAEIAFTRIVKMEPEHREAIQKLVDIFLRQDQPAKAVRALQRLEQLAEDRESRRDHLLQLAQVFEQMGQHRDAEKTMESCRQQCPTDAVAIRALAEFYRRQGADTALAVHLNRASGEFRNALLTEPTELANWEGLVEVLSVRGHLHAARACASTAMALGLSGARLEELVDADGAAPALPNAVADPETDRIIAPAVLAEGTRRVFQGAASALEKALPFDLKWHGAQRIKSLSAGTQRTVQLVCEWFGISDIQLYETRSRMCMPLSADPVTVLMGESLFLNTTEDEKRFLLVRAVKIAMDRLCIVVRSQLPELSLAINALIRHFDNAYEPESVDIASLDEMARRVGKGIPKKIHEALGPAVFEMGAMPHFDPIRLPAATYEFATRAALVATGASGPALSATIKLAGLEPDQSTPEGTVRQIATNPEAKSLLAFALSDAFLEARQHAGSSAEAKKPDSE